MIDLNLFATQLIPTGQTGSKAAALGAHGIGNAANFLEIILENIEQNITDTKSGNGDVEASATQAALKNEEADLALLQLALLGQGVDNKLTDLQIERINNRINNRVDQLTKLIDHLTNGLPVNTATNGSIEQLISRLEHRLEKLEASLNAFSTGDFGDEGAPFQLLIATGLSPSQITKITSRIEEVEAKLGRELTVEDLIAGVGNIIPAPGDDDHPLSTKNYLDILFNKTKPLEKEIALKEDTEKQHAQREDLLQETVAAGLSANQVILNNNKIKIGLDALNADAAARAATLSQDNNQRISALQNALANTQNLAPMVQTPGDGATTPRPLGNPLGSPLGSIPQQLSNAEFNALFASAKGGKNSLAKANFSNILQAHTNLTPLNNTGDVTLPLNWLQQPTSLSIASDALGFDIQTGTPFNPSMQAVHAATSIPQAGQPHPATQMVSAHISKAAQKGEAGKIVLQLDPPELGRVEIKLEFGHDKSIKAHLVVEKPETLLMLQRDVAALERALQNAGLETDSGSLNYQMADDNYAFNNGGDNNNQNNESSNSSANNGAEDEDGTIIETTMTWDVDPKTGHVHYNLLA